MEEKRSERDIASNETNDDRKQTNENFEHICDFFSPLRDQWPLIQEILLWRKLEMSVIVFNILNVLFWIFLTPRLQLFVSLAILLSLLWLTPPIRHWVLYNIRTQKLSTRCAENLDSDEQLSEGEQVKSSEKKILFYEDFCHGVAVIWGFLTKYWIKLRKLKEENRNKFYVVIALLVVILAVVYTRFPIGNILYLMVMFLYLWPAVVFYGIKDKVVGKVQKLFRPFFTQWQSSRTKRKRNTVIQDRHTNSDVSDDEDFTLNATETETILSSVISPVERPKREKPADPLDSVNSSLTFIDGLEFPSIRRDSAESFNSDDFAQGLNFSSVSRVVDSHHSSMDSLVGQNDTTLPSQNDNVETTSSEENVPRHVPRQSQQEHEPEMRHRTNEQSSSVLPLPRNNSLDDVESYEVIDTSEIDADANKELKDDEQQARDGSYIGKLFGYSYK